LAASFWRHGEWSVAGRALAAGTKAAENPALRAVFAEHWKKMRAKSGSLKF
jgi:hypothetical protein